MPGATAHRQYQAAGETRDDKPLRQGDTITLSPTVVIDLRYGVTHIRQFCRPSPRIRLPAYGMPANAEPDRHIGTAISVKLWDPSPFQPDTGSAGKNRANHAHRKDEDPLTRYKGGRRVPRLSGNWQDLLATPALNASNHNGQPGGLSGAIESDN
jgi:hypothetical protein